MVVYFPEADMSVPGLPEAKAMDSFIVRIYKRSKENPGGLVGITEIVKTQEKKVFKSFDELLSILSLREPESGKKNAKSGLPANVDKQ